MTTNHDAAGRLDWRFVGALLGYGLGAAALLHLFQAHPEPRTVLDAHLETLTRGVAALSVLGVLALAVLLLIAGAGLLQAFWNRFLSDVFGWRLISLAEAMAIHLLWWLLFAGAA